MSWTEGTIEEFKGGKPENRELRKIRTRLDQTWQDLYFFRVSQARAAGYPDSALAAGRRIEFEPDPDAVQPRVRRFKPAEATSAPAPAASAIPAIPAIPAVTARPVPARTFLNPYHFVPLAPPPPPLADAETVLRGTFHDRFDGDGAQGPRRYCGRIVCRLQTKGPVVVGAEQRHEGNDPERERVIQPFGLPDPDAPEDPYRRTPMIPGSTLRGLISSIVEAASCSTLRVLEDGAFECRDATRKKIPIPGSLHGAVKLVSPDLVPLHSGRFQLTLAEQLFGFVEQGGKERALAGRLRFSHALVEGDAPDGGWYDGPVLLKILASPKPPSPALYFGNQGYLSKQELDLKRHSPQGRKFYLHHPAEKVRARSYESRRLESKTMKQKARVRPLKESTCFLFHVDFENLTRDELGHLVYALRPAEKFRHKLGMAKPLGLGRVRIDPLALAFIDRRNGYAPESLFSSKYRWVETPMDREAWRGLSSPLADRYRHEAEAAGNARREAFPGVEELRAGVRASLPEAVRHALELLGDPDSVEVEVSYPVLRGQGAEDELFRWFVRNDNVKKKALASIKPQGSLPTLDRYEPH